MQGYQSLDGRNQVQIVPHQTIDSELLQGGESSTAVVLTNQNSRQGPSSPRRGVPISSR